MDFRSMVRELNRGLGIPQAEIGAAIGVKQSTVSDLLTGRTKGLRVSYQTADALRKFHADQIRRARRSA